MKLIKLTSFKDKSPIYINVYQIGHFYTINAKIAYGRVEEEQHTRVGVTTHNNGGFSVCESVTEILKLIEK